MFRSIRWRLPLTYAAIALIAALALGAVLLVTLRDYYAREETSYLLSNARAIGTELTDALSNAAPPPVLQSQLDNFAFLSQVQLRVLNPAGETLAASSITSTVDILVAPTFLPSLPAQFSPRTVIFVGGAMSGTAGSRLPLPDEPPPPPGDAPSVPVTPSIVETTFDGSRLQMREFAVSSSPFGFTFDTALTAERRRSDQRVREALIAADGRVLGYLEVFDGPAYGSDIVDSVAQGWLIASSVAVLLAAIVGWLISRRLTQPVLQLTAVTQRMAEGDLTTRANTARLDELGTLARSLNDMADQVEATITTLRRFVSDAAHELHTPLTALHTELELAESRAAAPLEDIRRARAQVTRLEELTQGLLDLSRVEAPTTADSVQFDLAQLARDLSEIYASQADQSGLAFTLELADEPLTVRGQPDQLRRAIGNLLDNAIKFTPEGGTIQLRLHTTAQAVLITVEDTGLGIPVEDLAQLFGRFHRGRNASTYPGHGLGLAIVKAIAEAHGGTVHAENTGHGARFSLRLPCL